MPRFEPFAGLRYATEPAGALDDVSCPPYDVINLTVRQQLMARSPYNMIYLEWPDDLGPSGEAAPAAARATLDEWRSNGVLRRDPGPVFYGYRTTAPTGERPAQHTVGVIGAVLLEEPGAGILPHEETTRSSRTGHSRLLAALRVNVSPIWALTPTTGLAELTDPPEVMAPEVMAHALDEEGVLHELWPITDPERMGAIAGLVGSQALVLADGHHRYETALAYHAARQAAGHGDDGSGALMTYVVELSEQQLHVQAIHRLVTGVADPADLLDALRRHFTLEPTAPADATMTTRMAEAGALGLITAEGTWLARPVGPDTVGVDDLDSRRLDTALADLAGVRVSYQHGWEQVAGAVATGQADAAVLLRPPTVPQIAAISRGGVRMPPKSTFFWPKPRTGLVLRELDT